MRRLACVLIAMLMLGFAQARALDFADVDRMFRAGIDEDAIIEIAVERHVVLELTPEQMLELRAAGASGEFLEIIGSADDPRRRQYGPGSLPDAEEAVDMPPPAADPADALSEDPFPGDGVGPDSGSGGAD